MKMTELICLLFRWFIVLHFAVIAQQTNYFVVFFSCFRFVSFYDFCFASFTKYNWTLQVSSIVNHQSMSFLPLRRQILRLFFQLIYNSAPFRPNFRQRFFFALKTDSLIRLPYFFHIFLFIGNSTVFLLLLFLFFVHTFYSSIKIAINVKWHCIMLFRISILQFGIFQYFSQFHSLLANWLFA